MNTQSTIKSFLIAAVTGCLLVVACETKSKMDSNEVAEEKNEAKFEGTAEKDAEFMADIAICNLSEVKTAELAADRAKSTEVKEFASLMVDEHKKMYADNVNYAMKNNISIADTVARQDISGYENLRNENGNEFDKKFINTMVDDHKKLIDKLEDISKSDKYNQEINSMASQALPKVRMHYDKAKDIQAKFDNKM